MILFMLDILFIYFLKEERENEKEKNQKKRI
jgi:hypothetical protein